MAVTPERTSMRIAPPASGSRRGHQSDPGSRVRSVIVEAYDAPARRSGAGMSPPEPSALAGQAGGPHRDSIERGESEGNRLLDACRVHRSWEQLIVECRSVCVRSRDGGSSLVSAA